MDLGWAPKLYSEDVVDSATKNNYMTQYTAGITSCFDESFQEGSILPDFLTH